MAREAKNWLSYIPVDCNFFDKPKMFQVEERFGEVGTLRALRLLLWLSDTEGCWLEWNDGSAYYFAKKILGKAEAAGEVEDLVRLLIEIGFFTKLEETDERGERHVYLTSLEIVSDWIKIKTAAKQKVILSKIPRIVYTTYIEQLTQRPKKDDSFRKTSEEKGITSEGNTNSFRKTSEGITQTKVNKKEKKKEINSEVIQKESGSNPDPSPSSQDPALLVRGARDDPHWEEVRLRVSREIYSQYLSADLVDAITALAVLRWITPAQLKDWFRKARDETELYRNSKGHAGKAMKWEVLRPLAEDVYLAHSLTLPPCDSRRREPPPEPERTRSADVGYDAATRAGRAVMAMT